MQHRLSPRRIWPAYLLVVLVVPAGCKPPHRPVPENIRRGNEALEEGQLNSAIRYFNRAIRLEPRNADGYLGRAQAYALGNQPQLAADDFSRAIAADPGNPRAHRFRAKMHLEMNQYSDAWTGFNRAIRLGERTASNYYLRGECYLALEMPDEARDDFERALARKPGPELGTELKRRIEELDNPKIRRYLERVPAAAAETPDETAADEPAAEPPSTPATAPPEFADEAPEETPDEPVDPGPIDTLEEITPEDE